MDFSWSDEDRQRHKQIAEFAALELCDGLTQRDESSSFSKQHWKRCAQKKVIGWASPAQFGGSDYSPLTCAYLLEALGYGCQDNGLLFALGTQMWGVQSCLLQFGSDQQKQRYIPAMIDGNKIGAYAINEPASGSDAFAIETTAVEDGDNYIINGVKSLISMAPQADFAVIFAVTNPAAGRWGLSAFIIDTDTPGVDIGPHETMMGLRTVPFGAITLKECRVPKTSLLGKPGTGASIFSYSQSWERSLMLAPTIGTMQRQLETCIAYTKSRNNASQAISKYQAVSHRIANMQIRVETSRLLLYKTAWMLAAGKQNLMEAAITKTYVSEAFVESSKDVISLHGGSGYLSASGIERDLRDAMGGTIYGGTADIQRNIIAGLTGL